MTSASNSANDNKAVVRRIPNEIMTEGVDTAIEEVFAADFVEHNPTLGEIHGPDGFRNRVYKPLRDAFSDLEVVIEELIAEDNRVVLRATIHGIHEGEFNDIEATGNTIEVPVMVIHRVEDGLVAERWVIFDALSMMQQLDVIPNPPDAT
ncbi:ester cyclase [Halocatena marina]|uniref:ester cyclase n=1 Tax=Halocatena marina TaxID=2934937 RepID=UPI00200DF11B|nr:ester cyclase [Halocatena marina]